MASITSVGVGSGLDLEDLITNIVEAERAPTEARLNIQEAETQGSISAFGSLKSTLSAFQDTLSGLTDSANFSSRKATSGNTESFTATSDSSAEIANYNIAVLSLASASKVATNGSFVDPDATVGEGTLTLGFVDGDSFDIAVAATDSISDIRDAINNATDNTGITASLLTVDAGLNDGSTITELVLTSTSTGEANQITISVDDTGDADDTNDSGLSLFYFDGSDPDAVSNQLTNKNTAQDASITVDGFTAYSASNVFDSVIDGISITAVTADENPSDPTSAVLNVAIDTAGVQKEITSFAATYNELIIVLNQLTDYNAETETRGILSSDSSARIIEQQIRRIMSNTVEGAPSDFNSLAYLGFATNQNGTMKLDEDDLSEAISSNFDDLSSIFTGDSGIATQLDDLLESFLQSGGTIDVKENILKEELDTIEDARLSLGYRLEAIEARYRSQFAALDILVAQLNQTGNFLSEQLEATANIISGSKK
ncbi:flagellar filament capping protein FliD [Oceanicoccus sp. KOV_DT_Chl]|uniref:flagellar filament capping protein FliD n=1 Tax=Oceanicoccus sp. KOV_DT_Chl TaxID=1904639 RepID=UPI000C7E4AB2|nr:flagellar filament capping protein FliD [Oceanicoccus sp. KOV_DT_Chl]